jgi:hypothetical protein
MSRVFKNSDPFTGQLDVVATIAGDAIKASIAELRHRDRLTIALRAALRLGASIDDVSAASGLTPSEVRRRVESALLIEDDLDEMAGVR